MTPGTSWPCSNHRADGDTVAAPRTPEARSESKSEDESAKRTARGQGSAVMPPAAMRGTHTHRPSDFLGGRVSAPALPPIS